MKNDNELEELEVEETEEVEVEEGHEEEEEEVINSMSEKTDRNINLYKMYYTFNGDVKGPVKTGHGDQHISSGDHSGDNSEINYYQIGQKEMIKVKSVYEPVPNYHQLANQLAQNHFLVLMNTKQTGKYTTALHLLMKLGAENLIEIYPETPMQQIAKLQFEENTGYVIDGYLLEVDTNLLKFLSEKLKEVNSFFILTVHKQLIENQNHYIQKVSIPERAHSLLQNHVSYWLGEKPDILLNLAEVINDIDFRIKLKENLIPSEADGLVSQLIRWNNNEIELEDVFSALQSFSDKEVEKWFKEVHNLDEISLAITLAIFHDIPYEKVLDEQKHVLSLLQKHSTVEKGEVSFSEGVLEDHHIKIKRINAKLYKQEHQAEFGSTDEDYVVFHHESYAESIIRYVWNAYYQLRKPLLEWLKSYANVKDDQLKKAVQDAIKLLANLDFRRVKEIVIQPCAANAHPKVRFFAVEVLEKLVFESNELVRVRSLLHHWAKLNHPQLTWTAIASYRTLGTILPDLVFQDLLHIVLKDGRFHKLLRTTVKALFLTGQENKEMTEKTLVFIKESYEKSEQAEPLFIFLSLLRLESVDQLPYFFSLLEEEELREQLILPLIAKCLADRNTRKITLRVIYDWLATTSEKRQWFKRIALSVLEAVYLLHPTLQKSLFYTFNSWAENPKHSNIAFKKLVQIIAKNSV